MEDWAAVQRVYKATNSKRKTAQILKISRNTVKRLLEMKEPPQYQRTIYFSKIDEFKEQIIVWRCEPYYFNGTRIFRELKKLGYDGSIGPIYRYLRKIDEDTDGKISRRATVRHESPPGDQAQFDWSEYQVLVDGVYTTVYCFSLILAASRKKAVCFSKTQDADAIYEAIQELFDELGGVTLELLIDNPKALVIENNPKSEEEIRYNPEALMMAKHLGTELNACPCYWPRKKGKVERPFSYIEEQFIKGNVFSGMEDLNRRGKKFVDDWCNEKHTTTQRVPNEYYLLEERAQLQPLPSHHYYVSAPKTRKVSPDSYVSIQGNKYSVPVKYVDRRVRYRLLYGFRIRLWDRKDNHILDVEAALGKHKRITDLSHYEAIARKVPTSIPQIRRDFTSRFQNGAKYLEAAGRKFDQPTHYARKIMELQDLYDDDVLNALIGIAVSEDKLDVKSFRTILREYNSGDRTLESSDIGDGCQPSDTSPLTRDLRYYEEIGREVQIGNP